MLTFRCVLPAPVSRTRRASDAARRRSACHCMSSSARPAFSHPVTLVNAQLSSLAREVFRDRCSRLVVLRVVAEDHRIQRQCSLNCEGNPRSRGRSSPDSVGYSESANMPCRACPNSVNSVRRRLSYQRRLACRRAWTRPARHVRRFGDPTLSGRRPPRLRGVPSQFQRTLGAGSCDLQPLREALQDGEQRSRKTSRASEES